MTEFTFSRPLTARKNKDSSVPGNVAYALFVLFCFWAGAQLLNMLVHAPGIFEHLMQQQDSGRPRIEIDLAVGTLFGLVPFPFGSALLGGVVFFLRWRRYL